MTVWKFLEDRLDELESANLYREPDDGALRRRCDGYARALGVKSIDASSNDYLGYATQGVSRETSWNDHEAGPGASRLIHGTRPPHCALEGELSDWLGQPATLLFSSGYAANIGVLSSLPQDGDLILSDALNHASIVDGCRLSRAEVSVYPHLDLHALETKLKNEAPRRRCWVVSESYFSMDGDSPDLRGIRRLCDHHKAMLILDEAHALGVFGLSGRGLGNQHGISPDVLVGTFGKAIGAQGAFASSATPVRNWLWNKARSFVYSTATSPVLAARVLENVRRIRCDDACRARLTERVRLFRERLREASVSLPTQSHGPIVPIILGTPVRALEVAQELRRGGILVQAIRPPTVPPGHSRIRVTIKASMDTQDVERLASLVISSCKQS